MYLKTMKTAQAIIIFFFILSQRSLAEADIFTELFNYKVGEKTERPVIVQTEAAFQCQRKIDMVILLDSSASVTRDQFAASKKFATDLVKYFKISKERTNVAALSFSQYTSTGRSFSDDASKKAVLKAIDGLSYEGSFTRLDLALDTLLGKTFNKEQGARSHDKGVKKVVVVLTDGFSSRGIEVTKELTERLKRIGARLFSVGTSDRIYKAELDELASKPKATHELIIDFKKYQATKDQVQQFAKVICEPE